MDGRLTQLSDGLAPPEEKIRRGNAIQDRLTRILQADKTYNIDRVRLAGGMQKKTSIGSDADYDLVAFLNGVESSETVLLHFKDVVAREFGLGNTQIQLTPHGVTFTYNGIDFDLLFAQNLAKSHSSGAGTDPVWRIQHAAVLKLIKLSDDREKTAAAMNVALTEAAFEFVKQQSAFVHKVARLAKYWNSKVSYRYIFGRSSTFELLGIKAGREEEEMNGRKASILNAFRRFLEKVTNLESQRIIFEENYKRSDIPSNVINQTPLLMDPSSPYNNILNNFSDEAKQLFIRSARITSGKLERAGVASDLEAVFEQQNQ